MSRKAETTGFEPADRFDPITDLANRRFRPLSHISFGFCRVIRLARPAIDSVGLQLDPRQLVPKGTVVVGCIVNPQINQDGNSSRRSPRRKLEKPNKPESCLPKFVGYSGSLSENQTGKSEFSLLNDAQTSWADGFVQKDDRLTV